MILGRSYQTIAAMAARVWRNTRDVDQTIEEVTSAILADSPLVAEIIREAVGFAAQQASLQAMRSERGAVIRQARAVGVPDLDGLMKFTLMRGLELANATRTDLNESAAYYRAQARTNLERAKWLELIASKLSGNQRVRDALNAKDLAALLDQAQITDEEIAA